MAKYSQRLSPSDREDGLPDEETSLLDHSDDHDQDFLEQELSSQITRRLYISHFLSTWNSRVFEFGAVLYLATAFPGTLLPMSVYALARSFSAIILAPAIGHYIDTSDRLSVVRASIVFQRLAVGASCILFYVLICGVSMSNRGRVVRLAMLSLLACVEKVYSIVNLVSVEKDWVVVLARNDQSTLATLNAQMRRIDLLCKLLGPLFIALVDGFSTEAAIITNLAMNMGSVIIEYFAIAQIYDKVPDLQKSKRPPNLSHTGVGCTRESDSKAASAWHRVRRLVDKSGSDFSLYFRHRAFVPSIAGALLYLTVLSFSGQMVTYLVASGYSTRQVGIARTVSVVFEVMATWAAPWLMRRIGPVRAGLWMSNFQVIPLVAGIIIFWFFVDAPIISASGLVVGTIVSRLGLRGFDLCMQVIVQEEVEAESRGAFSSVEAAWQNAFELLSYLSTIIFFRPSEFVWPSIISVMAVTAASAVYASFVHHRRGHLLHFDKLSNLFLCGIPKDRRSFI